MNPNVWSKSKRKMVKAERICIKKNEKEIETLNKNTKKIK